MKLLTVLTQLFLFLGMSQMATAQFFTITTMEVQLEAYTPRYMPSFPKTEFVPRTIPNEVTWATPAGTLIVPELTGHEAISTDAEWDNLPTSWTSNASSTESGCENAEFSVDWNNVPNYPDPNCLPKGWKEVINKYDPKAKYFKDANGNFFRFDPDGGIGPHWHWYNNKWLKETSKSVRKRIKRYYDKNGTPVRKGSKASHIKGGKPCS